MNFFRNFIFLFFFVHISITFCIYTNINKTNNVSVFHNVSNKFLFSQEKAGTPNASLFIYYFFYCSSFFFFLSITIRTVQTTKIPQAITFANPEVALNFKSFLMPSPSISFLGIRCNYSPYTYFVN